MKVSRLERILRLLTAVQSGQYYNPNELADRLAVSRRTIFRDLEILYKAGIACYYDEDAGGYQVDKNVFLPPLNLKINEALALLLVARHAGTTGGLPLQSAAQEAALKLASVLPSHIRQHCGSVLQATTARFAAGARHEQLDQTMALLQRAIRQRRKVKMVYISFYEQKQITTTLSPYHLHFAQRAWYVIGHSSLHQEVRTFKLGRIKNIELLQSKYLQDEPFRMEEFLGDAWSIIPEGKIYDVKLNFKPLVAANVAEVLWHRRQKLTWHDDGSLTFEVQVDGLGEITWWIAGYGDQVEVLAPAALCRRLTQMAKKMVEMYE